MAPPHVEQVVREKLDHQFRKERREYIHVSDAARLSVIYRRLV